MEDIKTLLDYLRAYTTQTRHDERGFTAVEWLMIALGVIVIAGIAIAAVKAYVTGQTHKLGNP